MQSTVNRDRDRTIGSFFQFFKARIGFRENITLSVFSYDDTLVGQQIICANQRKASVVQTFPIRRVQKEDVDLFSALRKPPQHFFKVTRDYD